jgi:hypothetical protein
MNLSEECAPTIFRIEDWLKMEAAGSSKVLIPFLAAYTAHPRR